MKRFDSTCFGPRRTHTFRGVLAGFAIGFSALTGFTAAGNTLDLPLQINRSPIFYQNLTWIGDTPPADAENRLLWNEIQKTQSQGLEPILPALERFIADHPDSPWVPSLRANLGRYYREHGRYTKALQHWELAWNATHSAKNGPAKNVADFTFAHWTRLLGSLGRADTLRSLLRETQNRVFDAGPLQQIIKETKEGYSEMLTQPGISFKCGTFALINVAMTIKGPAFDGRAIDAVPSPRTGFNMTKLKELAEQSSLDLVPAEWGDDKEIVVPSVIHWKEDHFAAIIEQRNNRYRVVDPTFEEPRWLRASEILEEASGHFLVPKDKLPTAWRVLTAQVTDSIFGRGRPYDLQNKNDGCRTGSGGGGGSPDCGCHSGGGSGGPCGPDDGGTGGQGGNASDYRQRDNILPGDSNYQTSGQAGSSGNANMIAGDSAYTQSGKGMPIWRVSDPYLSVWLYDTPLSYSPGLGYPVVFKMAYKQRETKVPSSSVFSIGNMWNCNWLGYVTFNGDSDPAPVLELPGGGERTYTPDGATRDFLTDTTLACETDGGGHTVGYLVSYANGAKEYYNYVIGFQGEQAAFLTDQVDRYGHTNHLVYVQTNSLTLLQYVIDADGRTNTLSYTNSNFPAQPTSLTDPFGRTVTLRYDSTGIMTNVVDVAGISNSFRYDFQGWVTNLITPYGTTTFYHYTNDLPGVTNEFYEGTNWTYSEYFNIRTLKIVDPAGGTNVYVLRANSMYVGPDRNEFFSYSGYDNTIAPNEQLLPGWPYTSIDDSLLQYRNTFHWGPRQAAGLPDVIDNYGASDYHKARRRHWLHNYPDLALSQILSMEQDPSPNGVSEGQTTWYDYFGKVTAPYYTGTQSKPSFIVRVLPDTQIQYCACFEKTGTN